MPPLRLAPAFDDPVRGASEQVGGDGAPGSPASTTSSSVDRMDDITIQSKSAASLPIPMDVDKSNKPPELAAAAAGAPASQSAHSKDITKSEEGDGKKPKEEIVSSLGGCCWSCFYCR